MERFFATFSAEKAEELNKVISEYARNNSYIEISRSQPAVCYDKYHAKITIVVTSTFRNMTDSEKQILKLSETTDTDEPECGDPDCDDEYYSDIADPSKNR